MYVHCPATSAASTVRAMGQTLAALEAWMSSNRLHLNPDDDDDGALPEGRFIGFYAPGDEMSEVVSRCLPHRQ